MSDQETQDFPGENSPESVASEIGGSQVREAAPPGPSVRQIQAAREARQRGQAVSLELRHLFFTDDEEDDVDYVPGATESISPPALDSGGSIELGRLAREIEQCARRQASALQKSRGLLVASQLYRGADNDEAAFLAARDAAETSPKLGYAALSLRKKAAAIGDTESVERSFESTGRTCTDPGTRIHVMRTQAQYLDRLNRKAELGGLLDRAVRGGDADEAMLVLRIVHRLAQGQSLAGIDIPSPLKKAVRVVQQVLSDQFSAADGEDNPHTSLTLAARALAQHQIDETIFAIRESGIDANIADELHAALLGAQKEKSPRVIALLRDLAHRNPSRVILRELAARALEARDAGALSQALEQADPGAGTFSLLERAFLTACTGRHLQISKEDMRELADREEILALALGPDDAPTFDLNQASTEVLLVQLGSGLVRAQGGPQSSLLLSASAKEALEALLARDLEPELSHALDLLLAVVERRPARAADDIGHLSQGIERQPGLLVAGALFARANEQERAVETFRTLLSREGLTEWSAARALVQMGAQDAHELVSRMSELVSDPGVQFILSMEYGLRGDAPEQDLARLLSDRFSGKDSGIRGLTESEVGAVLLAASALATRVGDQDMAHAARGALFGFQSKLARLARLRNDWEGSSLPSEPMHGSALGVSDITERILSGLRDDLSTAALVQRGTATAQAEQTVSTALERILHFARSLTLRPTEQAAELGRLCDDEPTAKEVVLDLDKTLGRTGAVSPVWIARSKEATEDARKRHAYERLAELDEQQGDRSSALLWHRTLVDAFPSHVPSLLRLEETGLLLSEPSSQAVHGLAAHLPSGDREAYLLFAGAQALSQSDLRSARKFLEPLLEQRSPPLLALRGLSTVAKDRRDDELLLRSIEHLADKARTDLDQTSTAVTAALTGSRLGRTEEALTWARRAAKVRPDSFVVQLLLHSFLASSPSDDPIERAEQLEGFARSSKTRTHRVELWYVAGHAWTEAEDPQRAATCYEKTLEAAPEHKEAFDRLAAFHTSERDEVALISLIEKRLPLIAEGGSEHLALELQLAELLTAHDRPEDAKRHLEVALRNAPDHAGALRAHANVSAALGAHESAERSLVALRDRLPPSDERIEVLRSLGRLYVGHLGQMEKAMDAYQAVLEVRPDDEQAQAELVRVFCSLGLAERATTLQTKIIQAADTSEKKRVGALKLAEIYETIGKDPKRAGATLERTRKAWPLDGEVLQATVLFMDRNETGGSRGFLLDRAGKEARRKLESERLDGGLLDTLARVARLTGDMATAEATEAVRRATLGLAGHPLPGGGLRALDPRVDEFLAPATLSGPLRNLLRKTGAAMDAAFSVDLSRMGARPATSGPTFERLAQMAEELESDTPELFIADSLGTKCLPVATNPARLLIGSKVDQINEGEREYLLLRALKLRWLGAGALARSKEEDQWPMLVSLLHLFAPSWRPPTVDSRKVAQARALVEQGLARVGYDDDVPMLALEVIGALGNQGHNVGDLPKILAGRVALLGVGDPQIALLAMATSDGATLAPSGPSRFRWLEAHAEAKELLLFATTDQFGRARQALGLVEAASNPHGGGGPLTRAAPLSATSPTSDPSPGAPQAPPSPDLGKGSRAAPVTLGGPVSRAAPLPPRRPKPPPPKR